MSGSMDGKTNTKLRPRLNQKRFWCQHISGEGNSTRAGSEVSLNGDELVWPGSRLTT